MRLITPGTSSHELPPDLRRQHTLQHIQHWGVAALPQHPVPYRRWRRGPFVAVPVAVFVGIGALMGINGADQTSLPYVAFPLIGLAAWAVVIGLPVLLPMALADARRRRRLRRAVRDIAPAYGTDRAVPGQAGDALGMVTYRDAWLRLDTARGPALALPFSAIHAVQELPPKGYDGLPGIDVLARSGAWTEIRMTGNQEALAVLEGAGVPVVRAVNRGL